MNRAPWNSTSMKTQLVLKTTSNICLLEHQRPHRMNGAPWNSTSMKTQLVLKTTSNICLLEIRPREDKRGRLPDITKSNLKPVSQRRPLRTMKTPRTLSKPC
ncbi:uncharacterized protein LOC143291434 isoform X2 [Babylonia areolata]|uniref:uncharacterized protein LOC143291434 isoform X2 n=1 Tax=Babylonia areolata TaxID=304850 RepID=UPI003FCFA5B6